MSDLSGKTIVVTGASSGIGAATVRHLAQRGANLVLHGRSESERLMQVAQEATEMGCPALHFFYADFSQTSNWSTDDWARLVDQAMVNQVHGWVNNAGGDVLTGDWKDQTLPKKLTYLWQVDVTATLMLSREVGARMQAQAQQPGSKVKGSIVNVGWDQAAQGMSGESGQLFATTKGAVMAMSKSLAQSFGPDVRVNCVAPGWIKTQWGDETSEYWNRRAQVESVLNRWGRPEDVASVIGFLCSEQAAFVNGQVIPVNGGFRYSQFED